MKSGAVFGLGVRSGLTEIEIWTGARVAFESGNGTETGTRIRTRAGVRARAAFESGTESLSKWSTGHGTRP